MTPKNNLFLKIVVSMILVTFSILTCLITVEGYLRFINYNPIQDLLNGRELILKKSHAEDVQYELTPNASGLAWGTQVKINSFGFRDKEYDINKSDKYRIIAIGDSITFGNCLPLENTYSKVLEEMLATKKIEDDYDAKFLQYADGCMNEGFTAFGVDSEAALQPLFETIISINKMEI